MFGKAIVGLMMLAAVCLTSASAMAADPTLHDVYQSVAAGKLTEAQSMMDQVLRDHPDSAKAHYVEAELMAKQGRLADAQAELGTAERLAPGLPFAKAQAVQELQARIASSHGLTQPIARSYQAPAGGIPWGLLLLGGGVIAFIIFVARAMTRRNPVVVPAGGGGYAPGSPTQAYGAAGVPPMGPVGGGIGSGILGGLATGAAVGAGIVAGEALAHHLTDGHRDGANVAPLGGELDSFKDDTGGTDFGVSDGSSWDDSSGGGGDDWT